jgi:hypothetical protein
MINSIVPGIPPALNSYASYFLRPEARKPVRCPHVFNTVLRLLAACILLFACEAQQSPPAQNSTKMQVDQSPPTKNITKVLAGTKVKLVVSGPGPTTVGLWLFYDDCGRDVVHNFVPSGTEGTLTGDVCTDYDINYYKVSFSPAQHAKYNFSSGNLWVAEGDKVFIK